MPRPKAGERIAATRRISAILPPAAKKAFRQKGFAEGAVIRHWREIAGGRLARSTLPLRLSFSRGKKVEGATLHILADTGAALEVQHQTPLLIEKLNLFYGYTAVARISIHQGALPPKKTAAQRAATPLDEETRARIERATGKTRDPELKNALDRLGEHVLRPKGK
ncbi:MAG TPA: DciA family protein [Sphingomonadales bacterium]|nr:DciA family protein [Sphingomonadales bacterium]